MTYQEIITKALFIWIPKTAGTSICEAFGMEKIKDGGYPTKDIVTFCHSDIREIINYGFISQEYYDNAYKFCFIRNPYDRFVSLYSYFTDHKLLKMDFKTFAKGIRADRIGIYNRRGFSQFNPQVRWITDDCNVYRYEDIDNEVKKLSELFGIKVDLQRLNTSIHSHYWDYYDNESKEAVKKFYREDFDLGYGV